MAWGLVSLATGCSEQFAAPTVHMPICRFKSRVCPSFQFTETFPFAPLPSLPPSQGSSRAMLRGAQRPPAQLQLLWTWACPLTDGFSVSSIAWNKANTDLLAAGYSGDEKEASTGAAAGAAAAGVGGASGPGSGGTASGAGVGAGGAGAGAGGTAGGGGATRRAQGAAGEGEGAGGEGGAGGAAGGKKRAGARGMVALWSLRNLAFPQLVLETRAGESLGMGGRIRLGCGLLASPSLQYSVP